MLNKDDIQTTAIIFLGVARPLRLEAEVASNHKERFEAKYVEKTGAMPFSGSGCYHDMGEGKWGCELRIYFNASQLVIDKLRDLGFHIEESRPYQPQYGYRINSNKLWWALIEVGFHLGDNV